MTSSNSFLRLLSLSGVTAGGEWAARQERKIRLAMIDLVAKHGDASKLRLMQRVQFADSVEALWYLRQDVLAVLSATLGERAARGHLQRISALFKGILPQALLPRASLRFQG